VSARIFSGPSGPFRSVLRVPGDKSLAHRALILAAMAPARSRIADVPNGLDVASTQRALTSLGVPFEAASGSTVVGPGGAWAPPNAQIHCGNSATTMRLLTGALAARPFDSVLVGDASLTRRPMKRLVAPLAGLGASIHTTDDRPPVRVLGRALTGADVHIATPSAQVRTAVALAALQAEGASTIDSSPGFRDHTERWLEALGRGSWLSETRFAVSPGPLPGLDVSIPGDASSAAFLWAAAALTPGSEVTTPGVSLNSGRTGFLTVLRAMGARVSWTVTGEVLGDPVGDVTLSNAGLHGASVSGRTTAACIDELPLVGVVAAFAEGDTIVADAADLRAKESDRIAATVALIRAIGGTAEETADGFVVSGGRPDGGTVDAGGDHRIAMAGAVAASGGGIVAVEGFAASAVSWPGFDAVLEGLWSSR
jgi:3-phosphoshikimate 1-carboxyvinyltransferase